MRERISSRNLLGIPLPREPTAGALARRLVVDRLSPVCTSEEIDDAKTIVSELVNNAYLHGEGPMYLYLRILNRRARIGVIDDGEGADLTVRPGHGLQIVQTIASAWGVYEGATHVWADLAIGYRN